MKTKTKLIALLLCLVLVVAAVTGCSSIRKLKEKLSSDDYSDYSDGGDSDYYTEPSDDDYTVDADDYTSDYTSDSASYTGGDISVEEQVVFDEEGVKISVLEYVSSEYGDDITLLVENGTGKDITVSSDMILINGFAASDASFYTDVTSGKKSYDELYLTLNDYEAQCIGTPGNIEMYFNCYDTNYDDVIESAYLQIKTSAYTGQTAEMNVPYTEIANEKGVKIGFVGMEDSSYGGKYVYFYVENNSDIDITVCSEDASINDIMFDTIIYDFVPSNTRMITRMIIFDDELEENRVDSVEKVELNFEVRNAENYDNIFTTDNITIEAK